MFRLISILLLLTGAAAAGFGGWMMYTQQDEAEIADSAAATPPPEAAEAVVVAEAPPELAMTETAGAEFEEAPTRSLGGKDESASEPMSRSLEIASAPAMADEPIFGTAASAGSDLMNRLESVPIAHETPETALYGKSFEVTVAIDATGDATAADALPGTGVITEGVARVTDSVQAIVTGAAFEIEALSPEVQELSPITENLWRWKVTPLENGVQDLTIELFAMVGDKALPVRTYRDTVAVEVSRIRQAVEMAQDANPLAMVLGGIGSVLAGLFGAARFFRGG